MRDSLDGLHDIPCDTLTAVRRGERAIVLPELSTVVIFQQKAHIDFIFGVGELLSIETSRKATLEACHPLVVGRASTRVEEDADD